VRRNITARSSSSRAAGSGRTHRAERIDGQVEPRRPEPGQQLYAHLRGFDLAAITAPVGLWFATRDIRSRDHAGWLQDAIPHAETHPYPGGHLQRDAVYRPMVGWLRLP